MVHHSGRTGNPRAGKIGSLLGSSPHLPPKVESLAPPLDLHARREARIQNADHGRLLAEWARFAKDLTDPMMELTPEEFAPIASTFGRLRRIGHPFDPVFVALMDLLIAQVTGGDEDADHDLADTHLEDGLAAHWRAA